jgi:hypothetical protein
MRAKSACIPRAYTGLRNHRWHVCVCVCVCVCVRACFFQSSPLFFQKLGPHTTASNSQEQSTGRLHTAALMSSPRGAQEEAEHALGEAALHGDVAKPFRLTMMPSSAKKLGPPLVRHAQRHAHAAPSPCCSPSGQARA